jgi:hypothetical protein
MYGPEIYFCYPTRSECKKCQTPSLIGISVLIILRPIYLERYNMKHQNEKSKRMIKLFFKKK